MKTKIKHNLNVRVNAMLKASKTLILASISIATIWTGCKKDEKSVPTPQPTVNEEELITTMKLVFDDTTSANNDVTAIFNDPDGDGGNAPTQHDTIMLKANTVYHVQIILLDQSKNPADTISNEVEEEANDHHFFFHYSGANITQTYLDKDNNTPPLPLGLLTRWETGLSSTGTSQIILKHQPGVKNGTETPGETDIDVTFQTKIK